MQCEKKAIIFDLDGVITDTAEYHYQAWLRLAKEEGLIFNRSLNEQLRGISRRESLKIILRGINPGEEKIQELMLRKNRYYQEMIEKMSRKDLLPGVKNVLNELRCRGIKLALASASKNARDVLERIEITGYFDVIADGNSVSKTKPFPDIFLYAAGELEIEPKCCVVVEDAAAGIVAAHAAGMAVVGIGPVERVEEADLLYPSLADMNVEAVLSLLQ